MESLGLRLAQWAPCCARLFCTSTIWGIDPAMPRRFPPPWSIEERMHLFSFYWSTLRQAQAVSQITAESSKGTIRMVPLNA
jgi:hypothetical protein